MNDVTWDTPDAHGAGAPWGNITNVAPNYLAFSINAPDGVLSVAFNVPQEAGAYSFQELVTSESLYPGPTALTSTAPSLPEGGGIGSDGAPGDLDGSSDGPDGSTGDLDGSSDGPDEASDGASGTTAIPLALTGTVEITSSKYGSCDSSVGCQYDYTGHMALLDTARGIAALDIMFTASNSAIPIGMCANESSGDVPF